MKAELKEIKDIENKEEAKEKEKKSAKDFIKLKRQMMKQAKNNESIYQDLNKIIAEENYEKFRQQIMSQKEQVIYNFLFTENQIKEFPFATIIKCAKDQQLLKIINEWSSLKQDFIKEKMLKDLENNQASKMEWHRKYLNLQRITIEKYNCLNGAQQQKIIVLLKNKQSLFIKFATYFLDFDLINKVMQQSKSQTMLVLTFYKHLLKQNEQFVRLYKQIQVFQRIILKESFWKSPNFLPQLSELQVENTDVMFLFQLQYNFLHEIANNKDSKQFLQICSQIESQNQKETKSKVLKKVEQMFTEFNSSGETPLDLCLKLWKYQDIKKLCGFVGKIQNMIFSTLSLSKILENKTLNQIQREEFIMECLEGKINEKGFAQRIFEKITHKNWSLITGKSASVISYDTKSLKKNRNTSNVFPLIHYLNRYKEKSNLKIIQKLMIENFDKKAIKKRYLLGLQSISNKLVDINSQSYRLIEFLVDYYQQFLRVLACLPHGEVLQYLLTKSYINCFEISIHHSKIKKPYHANITMINKHFLFHYINNNPFLGEDQINKQILQSITNCKTNQKGGQVYNIIFELIKNFNRNQAFLRNKQFLPAQIKKYLKNEIDGFSMEDLMKKSLVINNKQMLLGQQLSHCLLKEKLSLLNSQEIQKKLDIQVLKKTTQRDLPKQERESSLQLILAQKILIKLNIFQKQTEIALYNNQSFNSVQNMYKKHRSIVSQNKSLQKNLKFIQQRTQTDYFQIRPQQENLQQKTQFFLAYQFDVYFPLYLKDGTVNSKSQSKWNFIFQDMIKDKSCFTVALKFSEKVKSEDVIELFSQIEKVRDDITEEKIIQSLYHKLFLLNDFTCQKLSLCSLKSKTTNLSFLYEMAKSYNSKATGQIFNIQNIIRSHLLKNAGVMIRQINNICSRKARQQQKKVEQIEKEINSKIAKLCEYLKKWIQISLDQSQKQKPTKNYINLYTQKRLLELLHYIHQISKIPSILTSFYISLSSETIKRIVKDSLLQDQNALIIKKQLQLYFNKIQADKCITPVILLIATHKSIHQKNNFQLAQNKIRSILPSLSHKDKLSSLTILEQEITRQRDQSQKEIEGGKAFYQRYSDLVLETASKQTQKIQIFTKMRTMKLIKINPTLFAKRMANPNDPNMTTIVLVLFNESTTNEYCSKALEQAGSIKRFSFYLKQQGQVHQYNFCDFYALCQPSTFDTFLTNLQKYHPQNPNLPLKLSQIYSNLINHQQWSRVQKLFKLNILPNQTVKILFRNLAKKSNLVQIRGNDIVKKIVADAFGLLKSQKDEFGEEDFVNVCVVDWKMALEVLPKELSVRSVIKCIIKSPEISENLLQPTFTITYNPEDKLKDLVQYSKRQQKILPIHPHNSPLLQKNPSLIHELRLQNKLATITNRQAQLKRTKQSCMTALQILPYHKQLYDNLQDEICRAICNNHQVQSLKQYEQYFGDIRKRMEKELMGVASGKIVVVKNVALMNAKLLREVISTKIIDIQGSEKVKFSLFYRILQICNMQIFQLFLQTYSIAFDKELIIKFEQHFEHKLHFWTILTDFQNEEFIINLIDKHKLLMQFEAPTIAQNIFSSICRLRHNKLLAYFLKHLTQAYQKPLAYLPSPEQAPATITIHPTQLLVYLPISEAISFNFYEYYFLIKQSNNECPKFNISGRLLAQNKPSDYKHVKQFARRIEIYQELVQHLKQALDLKFRSNVVMATVFQLTDFDHKFLSNPYRKSLGRFILEVSQGALMSRQEWEKEQLSSHCQEEQKEKGIYQKLCHLIFNNAENKIPQSQITKRNNTEMTLINKVLKFFKSKQTKIATKEIFQNSQFKDLLLIYNFDLFLELFGGQFKLQSQQVQNTEGMDWIQYIKGLQVHLPQIQKKSPQLLYNILNYIFFVQYKQITDSLHLKRHLLTLIMLSLSANNTANTQPKTMSIIKQLSHQQSATHQKILHNFCNDLNTRNGELNFDMMLWNKIVEDLQNIQKVRVQVGVGEFSEYQGSQPFLEDTVKNFKEISRGQMLNEVVKVNGCDQIYDKILKQQTSKPKKGVYIQLSLLMNSFIVNSQINQLQQKLQLIKPFTSIVLDLTAVPKDPHNSLAIPTKQRLQISLEYCLQNNQDSHLCSLILGTSQLISKVDYQLFIQNYTTNPDITALTAFCGLAERNLMLRGSRFVLDTDSCGKISKYGLLEAALDEKPFQKDSQIFKIKEQLEKLEDKLAGYKNVKQYSPSDISSPLNFTEESPSMLKHCLCFYEPSSLSPSSPIHLKVSKTCQISSKSIASSISQVENYMDYYILAEREEDAKKYETQKVLQLQVYENRDGHESIRVRWDSLSLFNVAEFLAFNYKYCSEINSQVEDLLDLRLSFNSLLELAKAVASADPIKKSLLDILSGFLYNKQTIRLISEIALMITEDVTNIMKIIKGIILKFDSNSNQKATHSLKINQQVSATKIDYQINQQLLFITINLQVKASLNPSPIKNQESTFAEIISRKQFLDSVFTSTQFLTDYFLCRDQINNECLKISKALTSKLNSHINVHIEYSKLYDFIGQIRDIKKIKQIDEYLSRLKYYLINQTDKIINNYLTSPTLLLHHEILTNNKFQSLSTKVPLQTLQAQTSISYPTHQLQTQAPTLTEITGFMNDFQNQDLLKNTYFLQIFKSYYSTIVREGMNFIVGYKSDKKKPSFVKIAKAEHIKEINIVELDYVLVVLKNIPTDDEICHAKIMRVFVTDVNRNFYKISDAVKDQLLEMPADSQPLLISEFVPLVSPTIKIQFHTSAQKPEATPQTKQLTLELPSQPKFKLLPTPPPTLTPLNYLKRNVTYRHSIQALQQSLKASLPENMDIQVQLPPQMKGLGNIPNIINLVCLDIGQFVGKLEYEPLRCQGLEFAMGVQEGLGVGQNCFVQLRKRKLCRHYQSIKINVLEQGETTIKAKNKQLTIQIALDNSQKLPSSSELLSALLESILQNEPQSKAIRKQFKNQSNQLLLKLFDYINILPYLNKEIERSKKIIKLLANKDYEKFQVKIGDFKGQIKVEEGVVWVCFGVNSPERQFYLAEDIVARVLVHEGLLQESDLANSNMTFTEYNSKQQTIHLHNNTLQEIVLLTQRQANYHKQTLPLHCSNNTSTIKPFKTLPNTKYYLFDKKIGLVSNYFWDVDSKDLSTVKDKVTQGTIGKDKNMYIVSNKPVNMNFNNLSITKKNPIFKDHSTLPILSKQLKKYLTVRLISKNIQKLTLNSPESQIFELKHHHPYQNLFDLTLESTTISISSIGKINYENTKFLELVFRNKSTLIKQKQKSQSNTNKIFKEVVQFDDQDESQFKEGDQKNIQNLVYVVNEDCKKFLTRAGEQRMDYVQLCDEGGNPIDYEGALEVYFVHINKLARIEPKIIRKEMRIGLSWAPTIRGHYYLYINRIRLNPTYEIGVCAAQADFTATVVTKPRITKICYCQQTDLMMDLRDNFGNIYSQLQQNILGDELILQIEASQMQPYTKLTKHPINKYGIKKLNLTIDNPTVEGGSTIQLKLLMNKQSICQFEIVVEGYSLKKRKQILTKEINTINKHYHKEIMIHRGKFVEDLFSIADKSLKTNFSVKFANQPGIDAGGLKRQFYDLVGGQMKSQRNPFFRPTDASKVEYFLNPELMRNKKRLQYMQLWGKYLANSILNNYLVGVSFSPVFIKLLYEESITYQDLIDVSPQESTQYKYLLNAKQDQFEDLELYFSIVVDRKKGKEVQLKEGGKQIPVRKDNVVEYLELMAQVLLVERYQEVVKKFREGFESVIEIAMIKKWIRHHEFWCLSAGVKQITPEVILNYITFGGPKIETVSSWFRRYISESNKEVLEGFLKFTSGSSSIDFNLNSKITVTFENAGENPQKLPISHTCWKEIQIPKYKNFDIMKKLLNAAFIFCSQGFGFG